MSGRRGVNSIYEGAEMVAFHLLARSLVQLAQRPDQPWSAILASRARAYRLDPPHPAVPNDVPAMPGRVRSSPISPVGQFYRVQALGVGDQATDDLCA